MTDEGNAVFDAVLDLVASRGITETTLRRVADRSGVDGKTLRRQYGSQFGLFMTAAKTLEYDRDRRLAAVGGEPRSDSVADRRAYLEAVTRALLPDPTDRRRLLLCTEIVAGARLVHGIEVETARMRRSDRAIIAAALTRTGVADVELETERLLALISGLAFELAYPHDAGEGTADPVIRHHIATIVH
ncbi:TetR family transcriptional regulator C-terminal domain-containing protein [Nocardia grenadensis]|uniref:TetR family transcriptional regulator C-terminal domain-containing protein n=1 Tax=Nocardia grenadensis TaxID=931537 RepID=UPI003D7528E4